MANPLPPANEFVASLAEEKLLSGLKIVVTALDLEQAEHRGIAYFSKSVIAALAQQGADIYLLTGLGARRLSRGKLASVSNYASMLITLADIIDQLVCPDLPEKRKKGFRFSVNYFFNCAKKLISILPTVLAFPLAKKSSLLPIIDDVLSPYSYNERINYIGDISGIFSAKKCYAVFSLCSALRRRVLRPSLVLGDVKIDLLVTCSPLSTGEIRGSNGKNIPILQIVHDMFTLEFAKHPDNPFRFYNRLVDATRSDCLFVSEDTRNKVCRVTGRDPKDRHIATLRQPPSLDILCLNQALGIPKFGEFSDRYILFSSSIVARKGLDLLIKAYLNSSLVNQGIDLVIAGKLHDDPYGQRITGLCKSAPQIKLLGYVNELEKSWLYLNATLLVSPSLSEGFGIPVLDAASMGLQVLASDIPPHREIAAIPSLKQAIELVQGFEASSWSTRLFEVCQRCIWGADNALPTSRMNRYLMLREEFFQQFSRDLGSSVLRSIGQL